MASLDDITTNLLVYAGRGGPTDGAVARQAVMGVIDAINNEMSNFVVQSRKKDIAVAAGAKTVTLPVNCRRVIELGRYDSETDRILPPYTEISERDFHDDYAGTSSLSAISPESVNEWFFLDDSASGARVIRLVFPPSDSFMLMVRFFEKLTDANVDRLENQDILFNGAIARLGSWFPQDAGLHYRLYVEGLQLLRSSRRSIKRTIAERVPANIAAHNSVAEWLVR